MDLLKLPPHILEEIISNVSLSGFNSLYATCKFMRVFIASSPKLMRKWSLVIKPYTNYSLIHYRSNNFRKVYCNGFNKTCSHRLNESDRCYGKDEKGSNISDAVLTVFSHLHSVESLDLHKVVLLSSNLHIILKRCNNSLETLIVKKLIYNDNFQPSKKDCQSLKKLKTMEIMGDWTVFKHLKKVQLEMLDVEVTYDNIEDDQMAEFMNFMGRQTELKDLSICGRNCLMLLTNDISKHMKFKLEHLKFLIKSHYRDSLLDSTCNENLLQLLRSQAPSLKSLHVCTKFENISQDDLLSLVLYELPQLKVFKFTMDEEYIGNDNCLQKENHSIVEFRIDKDNSYDEINDIELQLINCMKGLQKLSVGKFKVDSKIIEVLKKLENLKEIIWIDCIFAENLALPNVEKMEFDGVRNFFKMLTLLRSNPQVKELIIKSGEYVISIGSAQEFQEIFETLRNLEVLDLKMYRSVAAILQNVNFVDMISGSSLKVLKIPKSFFGNVNAAKLHDLITIQYL